MADINLNFGSDDLKKLEALLKQIQKAAKDVKKTIGQTGKTLDTDLQQAKKLATATKKITSEKKKLTAAEKEQLRLEKALETVEAKIQLSTSKEAKLLQQKQKQLRQINTQLRNGGKNTNTWSKALGSFQFKFNALGNIAANVTSILTRQLNKALRDSVRIVVDFDQAMADVKSITGATGKEFDSLSNSARQLGGSTKFTASQVAQLQKEYAKLGFTTKEIIAAQAATLDLAAATKTDLAESAEAVGITIRQFGLNASESGRVADVMARSFTSSALDMEKFRESMKYVGPAAKASGISLERTTAILGQLADAGISGSQAGTALRQIMLALSNESGTFSEKIARASEKGMDLAGATDEVQKRAATALLVMADGVGTIDDFTESLENATGAAKEMADIQLDTLAGQATLVKSAWEGMVLAMLSSEGTLNGVKWALGGIVDVLNAMALRAETGLKFTESMVAVKAISESVDEVMNNQVITLDYLEAGWKQLGSTLKEYGVDLWKQLFPEENGIEPQIESIKTLEDELTILKDKRDNASFSEVAAVNREISALERKINAYKEAGKLILPEIEKIRKAMSGGMDLDIIDFSLDSGGDEETKALIQRQRDIAASEQEEKRKSFKELRAINQEAYDQGEIDAFTYQDNLTKINNEAEAQRQEITSATFSYISGLTSTFSDLFASAKEKELSAAGDNAKKREQIEREYARKEQAFAIASALINGAEAITQIWSKWSANPVIAGVLTAVAAGTTAAQVGIIKNQKFAKGEVDINGPAHSNGGIPAEIEGGESVINKRSTAKYKQLLQAINEDDQMRIMDAMGRDKKINISGSSDPYNRKIYELMKTQHNYGEDSEYYYKQVGNTLYKTKK